VWKGKREQGEGEVNKGLDLWRGTTCLGDVELSVGGATSFQPQGATGAKFNRAIVFAS
jgi:hypothetical protein